MRPPRRNVSRWQHLAGKIIFPPAFPNGVLIDQNGYPVLDDRGAAVLPFEPLPDVDVQVVDPSMYHTLDPEERAEQRVLRDHMRTIDSNRLGHGILMDDGEYRPDEEENSSSDSSSSDDPTSDSEVYDEGDDMSMNDIVDELDNILSDDEDEDSFSDLDDPIEKMDHN